MKKILFVLVSALSVVNADGGIYRKGWIDFNKNGVKDVYEDPSAPVDARVEDLLKQMTVEEKTCQMVTLYGYKRVLTDELPTPEWMDRLWKDGMGAIDEHLNGFQGWGQPTTPSEWLWPASRHAEALNEVQRFFVEQTRLGIPVDFTNEGIRGVEAYIATNFPTQLGIGHTWDRELVRKVGYITGREARLLGYTNVYAPILDVGRDQRWGRYEEVYGESPYLVAELGVQMCLGLQTDCQVASTGKHFIAYSNNKGGREGMSRVDPQMGPHEVENVHVYPWREVIGRAGMLGVMSSYNDYDGTPVQGSGYWLTERLREDFGFKGYVVSDSDAVEYLHSKHHTAADMKESVYQSVMAGLNVRCTFRSPDSYVEPLRELVAEGRIPMSVIDDRVRDVLRVKFLVGLFDRPYQTDFKAADREVNSAQNNEIALRASRESLVLLKNDGILPLDRNALKKVAVVGPNADEDSFVHTHYGPLATETVTVLEGLRRSLDGQVEVVYAKGCELVDENWPESEIIPSDPSPAERAQMDNAVALAGDSDVIVAVMGGGVRTCGENKSRSSLELPGHQNLLLKELKATGKPVVLVLVNGRPLSVNWAAKNMNAILEAWYPGSHGGTAVAEALLGDYNPGGKLTVTFPKTVGQIPFNFPYKPASQVDGGTIPGGEGNQSRVNGALFDFGYGLSYTTFEYSNLSLSSSEISPEGSIDVSFDVTNTGDRAGDEIPQLYIHDCLSSITVYEKQLRGFDRISLLPGETRRVTFHLDASHDLSLIDRDFNRVVEPGDFEIMVGASSTDIRLKGTLTVSGSAPDSHYVSKVVSFPRRMSAGDELIVPFSGRLAKFYIDFSDSCSYEVQTTSGGGQFATVYSGSEKGWITLGNQSDASEVKLLIVKGETLVNDFNPRSAATGVF